MNKTQEAVLNAFCALIWKISSGNTVNNVGFSVRKHIYTLKLSEDDTILYLKTNNMPICTLGINIFNIEDYAEIVKTFARRIIAVERG